ncbi:hypothetical protein LPJ78_002353 [Coemansia sp. RSA 989]|nr:hypothetical protein BX667DRAFT_494141 [Coemansia mojavensis]KAJ1742738.1 hypothetical protein LPJ68_001617 [Coemansia sp. RSA 1086]KAJ1751349.1 hypothetical protein LPJ79_002130 [Coemansia sp. RSA 1821]KAJ1865858.1 hypothetical protein LPJ78_002353 [Coemansia sp. RSA 989]KAJ1873111.1 hypothetical protein LPJ55_002577 [Coemansia sp. RSA 990]KAJ2633348.1 hypothetical protein H4R22_000536 [Coemansia sp. RSA 1290]KAJ2647802.1 hypothetical protein IWW40_004424 [Coemansia sp. RSA 1250]
MGILKRIKNSYVFTHMEVGKYTKRRAPSQPTEIGIIRAAPTEYFDEFDRAASELRAEQIAEARQRSARNASNSAETLGDSGTRHMSRARSSMDLTAAQRERLSGRTAVSSPRAINGSPVSPPDSASAGEAVPRPRPRPARTARSNADMQSVYFAPGRNVKMTNQQKQRMSMYPADTEMPAFDKNSASSTDYYVFTPSVRQQPSQPMPLDIRRKQMRGMIAPEPHSASELHRAEELREQETNPFVERRRKAHKMAVEGWDSAAPFDDPLIGSGRGGIDPNHPRKHLNTPVYANQAGSSGLDLLA